MSVSKGGGSQASKSGFDPQTTEWIRRIYGQTMGQANQLTNAQGANAAGGFFGGALDQAQGGLAALGGDAAAAQRLMNPFQEQVVDAINRDWGQTNQMTQRSVDDAAQGASAFGGSRHGVATGTALAQNNMAQQNQLAALRAGGFEDAMGRAGQLANFGFGAASGAMDVDRQRLDMSPLGIMKYGLAGTPFGTTQKGKSSQWGIAGSIPGVG
jgi:hypothetical protein